MPRSTFSPTLEPVSFTSAYSPNSPSSRASRSRSPRRYPHASHNARVTYRLPHVISYVLTPRVLSPIILWSLIVYLIHNFLIPLPLPNLPGLPGGTVRLGKQQDTASEYFLSTAFPPPPDRQGDDSVDSLDPRYRPFRPLDPPEAPFPRLRPTRFLPPPCLEQWFVEGETTCGAAELGDEERLDATWLWVNGSDPRWRESMIAARKQDNVYSPEHHFREQNELVYSMRSVLAALPGKVKTFHLITADYPFRIPEDLLTMPQQMLTKLQGAEHGGISSELASVLEREWRIAQTPTWLDFSKRDPSSSDHPHHSSRTGQHYPLLRYATHSELFHLPTYDRNGKTEELGEHEWKQQQWRQKALPSFNSMSIESRIGWLHGLSDVTLALNDDFFLLRPHAVSDFHSPLYGSVIRFDPSYYQQVKPKLDKSLINEAGENGGLYHANWLLSQRFPKRLRPYFAHVPKVITRGLHHEASLMFAEALTLSSSRRFREMMIGNGDVQMQWLLSSLRVERWREALLWTYVVANMGARQGFWGNVARADLRDMFGLTENDDDVIEIEVHRGERWTLESGRMAKVFAQAGWEAPKATEFLFSSMDGHMPPLLKPGSSPAKNDKCRIDLDRCFGSFWINSSNMTSSDMFTRLAFQYPDCGDCLITALVTASGPLGLSAFLPPKDLRYTNTPPPGAHPKYLPPPHLPLTATWQETDFSLQGVLSTTAYPNELVDLREYTMKLLSRYQYLSARSEHHFHMLRNPTQTRDVLRAINSRPGVSILGLNDDIDSGYEEVVNIIGEWFDEKWKEKAAWEK